MKWLIVIAGFIACGGVSKDSDKSQKTNPRETKNVDFPEEWPEPDERLASKGEKLFMQKGCNACHTIGKGKFVGPDLKGLNRSVSYRWAAYMIMKPDSMLKHDDRAKRLLKEFGTPMPNQNVKPEEAEAILHYILKQSK